MSKLKGNAWLACMFAVVVVSFTALAFGVKKANDAAEAVHEVQCAQKLEYQDRLRGTQELLDNPEKYPGLKLPPDVLRRSITGLQGQLETMRELSCDE